MKSIIKKIVRKYLTKKIIVPVEIPSHFGDFLKDRTALIIGGSGGIGEAIARSFYNNGCKIIITGTNEKKLCSICDSLEGVKYSVLDVTNISDSSCKILKIAKENGPIDIFVYAAGVHCKDSFGFVTEKMWDSVMDINLKGMYFICQTIGNYMIDNNIRGHILTIGSASCEKPGWTPYEISKSAVRSLTLGFADKLIKFGITVNSIAPGPVATSMLNANKDNIAWEGNPSGRMCTPEEIANLATFMVSNYGNMIVGDTYFISGGSGTICIDK